MCDSYIIITFAGVGRIIAIDYGRKRTGLAVSDPMKIIAGGLMTLSGDAVVPYLKEYIRSEDVELILLGEPRQMNYQPSENMKWVMLFKKTLEQEIPHIPVQMVDERFTSVLAHRAMLDAGLKKQDRRNKALVDELSATIMLQSYIENIKK